MSENIKQVLIPKEDIPELDWNSEGYLIRYRIKTENKNLSSHWSPIYFVPAQEFFKVDGSFVESSGEGGKTVINAVWDDFLDFPLYDIFVAFDNTDAEEDFFEYEGESFFYHGSSQNHNYSFVKPEVATSLRIIVQPAANIKRIKERFIIFDSKDLQS
jgi:hypothetical protein